jgi:hypothetical protein
MRMDIDYFGRQPVNDLVTQPGLIVGLIKSPA